MEFVRILNFEEVEILHKSYSTLLWSINLASRPSPWRTEEVYCGSLGNVKILKIVEDGKNAK